jgi:hypothetical protein
MKTLSAADATAVGKLPAPLAKISAKRRKINPPPLRVIKGRGWVA